MRDDLDEVINSAAYSVYRRWKAYAEPEDLRQEMWVWALAQDGPALETSEEAPLVAKLAAVGEIYARRQKAASGGYSPSDEYFYSVASLRALLPLAVMDVVMPSIDVATMLADVKAAYKKLSTKYRVLLAEYVADEEAADPIGVARGLRLMQRNLGGRRPRRNNL